MYGARAFFASLNARGGVNGRTVKLTVCDDNATGAGNRRCARKLIEEEKVMAFVGNTIFDYSAAAYVDDKGVPDIGGQPIDNAYDQYGHLFSIYGTSTPRNGTIGVAGKLDGGTEIQRYFKVALGARTAGIVYYNQNDSQRYANLTAMALQAEGYTVVREQVDFSVPNFDAAAIDMRERQVDIVFDALDSAGNVNLCKAMDAVRLTVKAKVMTVQSWNESLRNDYAGNAPLSRLHLCHGHLAQLHGHPVPRGEAVPQRHAALIPRSRGKARNVDPRRMGRRAVVRRCREIVWRHAHAYVRRAVSRTTETV